MVQLLCVEVLDVEQIIVEFPVFRRYTSRHRNPGGGLLVTAFRTMECHKLYAVSEELRY